MEQREITNRGQYRIQAYEQFYRWQEQLDAIETKPLAYPPSGLDIRRQTECRGLLAQRADIVAKYKPAYRAERTQVQRHPPACPTPRSITRRKSADEPTPQERKMSYTLVPKNDGVPIFMANNLAYGCLLASADELCGEALNGIRIRPPEGNPDYRLNTWFVNDHQQVEARDASDLGLALQEALKQNDAKQCIADKYFARVPEARPGSAEAEKEITKLESKLQEFARFLVRSGGFEIW